MKLATVTYTASGEYYSSSSSRESITLTAELEEGDNYDNVLLELKQLVHLQLNDLDKYCQTQNKIQQGEIKLFEIKELYDEARQKYEEVKGIMRAAGINKDYPDFPDLDSKIVKALLSNDF